MNDWMTQSKLTSINKDTKLINQIVNILKEQIYSGTYKDGQKLPSGRELAEELKVSRAVIRQALKSLEQSGMVEIKIGSAGGAFVTQNFYLPFFSAVYNMICLGEVSVAHFLELRRHIECATVLQSCAKGTKEDLVELREINKKVLEGLKKGEVKEFNRAFHLKVAEMSGNPLIRLVTHSLLLMADTFAGSTNFRKFVKTMYEEHELIINAMENRDATLCELLMARHVEKTKELQIIDKSINIERDNPF